MHFVNRVRTIWSWLPAFRAVAEAEHLPTAAHKLGIVPSSLSRTVKQLEDELGVALFDRTSKSLLLNPAGRMLVAAVREAMRIVDDALGNAIGDELRGNVGVVGSSDLVLTVLIPAGAALTAGHPLLTLSALVARPEEMADMLLRGEADAAIATQPITAHDDLRVTELATWQRSVFARTDHAPRNYRCVKLGTTSDPIDDGWPAETDRVVSAWAPDERAALELCARSELVTIAFDAVCDACGFGERLKRLATPQIPSRVMYLAQRRAVGRHRRTEVLVEAIRTATTAIARRTNASDFATERDEDLVPTRRAHDACEAPFHDAAVEQATEAVLDVSRNPKL